MLILLSLLIGCGTKSSCSEASLIELQDTCLSYGASSFSVATQSGAFTACNAEISGQSGSGACEVKGNGSCAVLCEFWDERDPKPSFNETGYINSSDCETGDTESQYSDTESYDTKITDSISDSETGQLVETGLHDTGIIEDLFDEIVKDTFGAITISGSGFCMICWNSPDKDIGEVRCGHNHFDYDPPGTWRQIDAGSDFFCGIKENNYIGCWEDSSYPTAHTDILLYPPFGMFEYVDVGREFACALDIFGSVECWGDCRYGNCDVPSGEIFTSISVGGVACGINESGYTLCWGGEHPEMLLSPSSLFQFISVGTDSVCGILTDGTLECWGEISSVEPGVYRSLSVGYNSYCAVSIDGTSVFCHPYYYGPDSPSLEYGTANMFNFVSGDSNGAIVWYDDGTFYTWNETEYDLYIPTGPGACDII